MQDITSFSFSSFKQLSRLPVLYKHLTKMLLIDVWKIQEMCQSKTIGYQYKKMEERTKTKRKKLIVNSFNEIRVFSSFSFRNHVVPTPLFYLLVSCF